MRKTVESPSSQLEGLAGEGIKNQINRSESIDSHKSDNPGESNILPLLLKRLRSNGLDGDLVLHKEENNYSRSRLRQVQGLPKDGIIEDSVQNTCLVNVDPLTKSSTIITDLSPGEEGGAVLNNQDVINDDGNHSSRKS